MNYITDSLENPGSKASSRRNFVVNVAEGVKRVRRRWDRD